MIKYITILNEKSIVLNLMGREKEFINGQEVTEDAYTNAYPQYFKKIGEMKGYGSYLATPVFIPDPIIEFVQKEDKRKKIKNNKKTEISNLSKQDTSELVDEIEDLIEEKYDIDITEEDKDLIEDLIEDVKIETEE